MSCQFLDQLAGIAAVLQALVQNPEFCAKRYNLSVQQVSQLLKSDPAGIVNKLLKLDHLTDEGILELWALCKTLPRSDRALKKKYKKQGSAVEHNLLQALQSREKQKQLFLQKRHQEEQAKRIEL